MEKNRNTPQIQYFPNIINFVGYKPVEVELTTLPGKIKHLDILKGLAKNQLGKILGVDGATVCSWESGEFQPHRAILKKLHAMLEP